MAHTYEFRTLGQICRKTSVRRRNALIVLQEVINEYNWPGGISVTISVDGSAPVEYTIFGYPIIGRSKENGECYSYI